MVSIYITQSVLFYCKSCAKLQKKYDLSIYLIKNMYICTLFLGADMDLTAGRDVGQACGEALIALLNQRSPTIIWRKHLRSRCLIEVLVNQ